MHLWHNELRPSRNDQEDDDKDGIRREKRGIGLVRRGIRLTERDEKGNDTRNNAMHIKDILWTLLEK